MYLRVKECDSEECPHLAVYGWHRCGPARCAVHADMGMLVNPNARCPFGGCHWNANYGVGDKLIHCERHAADGERSVSKDPCTDCLKRKLLDEDGLCAECAGIDTGRCSKENRIFSYLAQNGRAAEGVIGTEAQADQARRSSMRTVLGPGLFGQLPPGRQNR